MRLESNGVRQHNRQPLRILHVLPDLDMGGGQQVLRRTLQAMDKSRFEHAICYFTANHEMRSAFEEAGASVHYFPYGGLRSSPRTLAAIASLVRREGIDVIHINGTTVDKLHGQIAGLATGTPVVSTLHGPRLLPPMPWLVLHRARELAEIVLDPVTTERIVAVSDSVLESWVPYLESRRVPRSRILINRNGVPIEKFDRRAHQAEVQRVRASLGNEGVYPILITVGRLDHNKAQRFLIPMMSRVRERWPDARLYIVGQGPLEEELRRQIHDAGLDEAIVLLGRRTDVPALLGMADVFVFSSMSEGLPLAVLEAMAASLPIVSFHLAGLDDIVEEGQQGFQVAPRDSDALAAKVLEVVADRERAAAMGEAARQTVVERYDVDTSVRCLERVYEEVARHDRS